MTHVEEPSVRPSVRLRQSVRKPNLLSDCQELQCLRRPQEAVERVRYLSTLAQSRRYFPERRQSLSTHTFHICEIPQGNSPRKDAEHCEV